MSLLVNLIQMLLEDPTLSLHYKFSFEDINEQNELYIDWLNVERCERKSKSLTGMIWFIAIKL